jgi:hypothetical protein
VFSNSLGTTAKIAFSAGDKDVFVTYPSDKALLGTTSAVASTGTGNVVLNNNPTFATDITVNGLTVGRGDGNVSTNTALGVDAIGSPYIISTNTNNVGIGYNALNTIGAGVGSLTVLTGGSYPSLFTDVYETTLIYQSGTPIIAGGVYPLVEIQTIDGVVTNINSIINAGYGWSATDTIFTLPPEYTGSGFTCQIASLLTSTNNTALGYNAGSTNKTGSNSVYLGSGASGTGTNEIVIGANAVGGGNNTVVIGNNSTTTTTIRGATQFFSLLTATGGLSAGGTITLTGNTTSTMSIGTGLTTGTILIGRTTGTGAITLGQSTGTQTVNVATGATASGSTKTVNIGAGGLAGSTTNIAIGSTAGTSTTTLNGTVNAVNDITVNGIRVEKVVVQLLLILR